jgi:hypothetical protein
MLLLVFAAVLVILFSCDVVVASALLLVAYLQGCMIWYFYWQFNKRAADNTCTTAVCVSSTRHSVGLLECSADYYVRSRRFARGAHASLLLQASEQRLVSFCNMFYCDLDASSSVAQQISVLRSNVLLQCRC